MPARRPTGLLYGKRTDITPWRERHEEVFLDGESGIHDG